MNVTLVNKAPLVEGLKFIMREGNLTIGAVLLQKYIKVYVCGY